MLSRLQARPVPTTASHILLDPRVKTPVISSVSEFLLLNHPSSSFSWRPKNTSAELVSYVQVNISVSCLKRNSTFVHLMSPSAKRCLLENKESVSWHYETSCSTDLCRGRLVIVQLAGLGDKARSSTFLGDSGQAYTAVGLLVKQEDLLGSTLDWGKVTFYWHHTSTHIQFLPLFHMIICPLKRSYFFNPLLVPEDVNLWKSIQYNS